MTACVTSGALTGTISAPSERNTTLRFGKGTLHGRIDVDAVPLCIDAEAQSRDIPSRSDMIGLRLGKRGGVLVVRAGNGCEDRSGIGGAARDRPHMIEACSELEDAKAADAPPSRLNSRQPHGAARPADRAAGVATQARRSRARPPVRSGRVRSRRCPASKRRSRDCAAA